MSGHHQIVHDIEWWKKLVGLFVLFSTCTISTSSPTVPVLPSACKKPQTTCACRRCFFCIDTATCAAADADQGFWGMGISLQCHCLFSNPHHGKEKICFVQENLTHGTLPTVSLLFQTCDEFQTYRTPDFPNNSPRAAFRHRLLKCYVQTNCGCYTQPFNACHKKTIMNIYGLYFLVPFFQ